MLNQYTPKQKILIYIIVALFALVYCSISLINHYQFRTSAYDLGIYNNMLYSYSHFKLNYTSIQQPIVPHAFADHFEPIFFLFAPFYWLFGSYTLLIIQIVFVLLGGLGAMRYVRLFSQNNSLSIAILIQFYSMWGVYSALAFDFHNNVTAAMLVPWFMVYVHQKKLKPMLVILALILLSKENMALYGIFVCLGLALHYFNDRYLRNLLFILTTVSAAYFVLVVKVIIPWFQTPGTGYLYEGMYNSIGSTPSEIFENLFNKPGYLFSLLFESYSSDPIEYGIKSELHFSVLVCGGIFLVYRPQFLVMLIPIYLQKMLCGHATRWGINSQYSIEFVPVLTICTAVFISSIKNIKLKPYLAFGVAACTLYYTTTKIKKRVSIWYNKENTCFYCAEHYDKIELANQIRDGLKNIPITPQDAVSAQGDLVPHLADRDQIYLYPNTEKATVIVLAPQTALYPLKDSAYSSNLDTLRASAYWKEVELNTKEVLLFKKLNFNRQ